MLKKIVLFSLVCFFILPVLAHEFWLSASKYRAEVGEKIAISFLVGEGFKGEKWGARGKRLKKFIHHTPQKAIDLTQVAQSDTASESIQVVFETAGTQLLTMTSFESYLELDGGKFAAYLQEDGIDDVYEQRQKNQQLDKRAREFYSRCAKTLVQIGNKPTPNFKKVVGMPLEIVPLQNPYQMKQGGRFSVKILFKNKPLPNTRVKLWHRVANEAVKPLDVKSDQNGIVSIESLASGEYMISLVKMIPHPKPQEADYQSYWASLTFGL
ncbi:MAG: DUF4198 domain-containing protein [Microscillaceae bacterium]|jgi:uncharacterized GH25 family protein|nr:DUF4198 domain-containing protein [Microscillaceae bacterium]